jgi:acyl-CoA thioester hydrolase
MRHDPRLADRASYPHHVVLPTMFSDMDVQRHVNNVAIARFFEEGRYSLHRAIVAQVPDEFSSVILAGFQIAYLREVGYPGTVEVAVGTGRFGRSSYDYVAALFQDGECVALNWATHVRRTEDRTASQPLSELEREALQRFVVPGGAPD